LKHRGRRLRRKPELPRRRLTGKPRKPRKLKT
jgi:hypothetical protein